MSAAEIVNELPKLSEADVRLVRQRPVELAAQTEDGALCNQVALEGAMMLDRLEAYDAAVSDFAPGCGFAVMNS